MSDLKSCRTCANLPDSQRHMIVNGLLPRQCQDCIKSGDYIHYDPMALDQLYDEVEKVVQILEAK